MSLKQAVASVTKTTSKSSDKNPAWYNRQKRQFVHNMVTHEDPIVRAAALTSEHCPSSNVNKALLEESDVSVVRSILLSRRANIKALEQFIETPMASNFDNDKEVEAVVTSMISGEPVVATAATDTDDDDESSLFEEEETVIDFDLDEE